MKNNKVMAKKKKNHEFDIIDYVIGGMFLLLAIPFLAGKLFGKTPSPFEHVGEIKRKK